MDASTLIMMVAAVVFFSFMYSKTPDLAWRGLKESMTLFVEILPRMVAAFLIAGLIQVAVPREILVDWMGKESGSKGILIGTILGTFTPGGPMMQFPIVASLYKSGVGIGPLISYLTAWSLLGFQRVIMWEIPFLGLPVVLVRVAASALFPFLIGWLSQFIWTKLDL